MTDLATRQPPPPADPAFLAHGRYGVLGAGRSGRAAAALLAALGKSVVIFDDFAEFNDSTFESLRNSGIECAGKPDPAAVIGGLDALVVSPGIPEVHPLLAAAEARPIPVRAEIELAWLCSAGARVAAVTGTNGKTTVTMLIERILADGGLDAVSAGNIGLPWSQAILERSLGSDALRATAFALEISSFQLESVETFAPEIGVLLNITPDHLDRHRTMEAYAELKGRITACQGADQVLVVNQDDPFCLKIAPQSRARVRRFSLERPVEDGAWLDGEMLMLAWPGRRPRRLMPMSDLQMIGLHNVANALAAACAADAMGVPRETIAATLAAFRAAPHRLEPVGTIDGVQYVNDSKATNLGAMTHALESFSGGVHLIAGGRDKASPFASVAAALGGRVRAAYLIGEAAAAIESAWRPVVECHPCGTLDRALETVRAAAVPGDVVLLAPGCASFDQFHDYAERGNAFRAWVHARTVHSMTTPPRP